MKTITLSLLVAAGVLSAGAVQADEALAKAKGCLACHTVDKMVIGPAYKDVTKKYAGQKDAEAKITETILKGTPAPAGLGWQKQGKANLAFMPPNATVKPDEASKLAKWILSLK
ncbi:c-type cytochrome [Propionivibrio sp.]|uniref:c-type cytochrome n=1 Tax=Propionivibrio sp. TaxID=2212460 RepID=UPI003BF313BD